MISYRYIRDFFCFFPVFTSSITPPTFYCKPQRKPQSVGNKPFLILPSRARYRFSPRKHLNLVYIIIFCLSFDFKDISKDRGRSVKAVFLCKGENKDPAGARVIFKIVLTFFGSACMGRNRREEK